MLTLYKYDELFQNDTERKLLVQKNNGNIVPTQIHFEYNGKSISRTPTTDGENTIVSIPDECLYAPGLLVAYEVVDKCTTIGRYTFPIQKKSKLIESTDSIV